MAWVAVETFEGYTVGESLNGKNGGSGWAGAWTSNALPLITSSVVYEGTRAVSDAGGNPAAVRVLSSAISDSNSVVYVAMRRSSSGAGAHYFVLANSSSSARVTIKFDNAGNITGNGTTVTSYSADTYYVLRITLNTSGNTYTVAYSTGAYGSAGTFSSDTAAISMASSGDIDRVTFDADTGANSYWDYISPTSPFVAGPASVKTFDGVTQSSGIKTYFGVATASVKSVNGIT